MPVIQPGERLGRLKIVGWSVRLDDATLTLVFRATAVDLHDASQRRPELHREVRLPRPRATSPISLSPYDVADALLRVGFEQLEHGLATDHEVKVCEDQGCVGPWPKWEAV